VGKENWRARKEDEGIVNLHLCTHLGGQKQVLEAMQGDSGVALASLKVNRERNV
jgi:hypothetical protein